MSLLHTISLLLLTWVAASGQRLGPVAPATKLYTPLGETEIERVVATGQKVHPIASDAKLAFDAKPDPHLGETKITEDIIEPKLKGNALAGLYRRYTGRRVIVTAAAAAAEFSFVQEASSQDPLTFASAAVLLRKAAVLENFVFVQHPQNPNFDILTLARGGTPIHCGCVQVYNEDVPLPEGNPVITYVMTLRHINPVEAVKSFINKVGKSGDFGSIAAVPNAPAIVITEKTSTVRTLIDLKKEIDVP